MKKWMKYAHNDYVVFREKGWTDMCIYKKPIEVHFEEGKIVTLSVFDKFNDEVYTEMDFQFIDGKPVSMRGVYPGLGYKDYGKSEASSYIRELHSEFDEKEYDEIEQGEW